MADGNRIRIDRVRAEYRVPATQANPDVLSRRLDRLIEEQLADALRQALRTSEDDPSVWFIRVLDIDCALDPGLDDAVLIRRLAEALAEQLIVRTRMPSTDPDVVRFDDLAHYYASYAVDVARGLADGRWFYADFEGLRPLPEASRLRTLLLREPALTWPILQRLRDDGLVDEVIGAMSPAAGTEVVRALAADAPRSLDAAIFGRLARARRQIQAVAPDPTDLRVALQLAATGARSAADLEQLTAAGERIAAIVTTINASSQAVAALRAAAATGDARDLVGRVEARSRKVAGDLQRLISAGETLGELLGWVADTNPAARAPATAPAHGARWITEFGFVYLLLFELAELPECDATTRWSVITRAAGPELARARRDPVLAWLAGLDRPPAEADEDPPDTRRLLDAAVDRLRRWRRVCGQVWIEPEPIGTHEIWLARDIADDVWVDAAPSRAGLESRLHDRGFAVIEGAQPADSRGAKFLAKRRPPDPDLDYLRPASAASGVTSALLAHLLIRSFARRLIGFGWSAVPHLRENLFPATCTATIQSDRIDVLLARVPLQLVLRMAGYDGRCAQIPWLGRELCVEMSA